MKKTHALLAVFAISLLVTSLASAVLVPKTVSYTHPGGSGAADRDCFDETNSTCLTRGLNGSVYNDGSDGAGAIRWGCGSCGNVSTWSNTLDKPFCVACFGPGSKMTNLPGKDLCLETQSNGDWNLTFTSWEDKGGGGFAYTRSGFIDWQEPSGPLVKSILGSSRPYWQAYAERCGITYGDTLPPQNLRRLCEAHQLELLNSGNLTLIWNFRSRPVLDTSYRYFCCIG